MKTTSLPFPPARTEGVSRPGTGTHRQTARVFRRWVLRAGIVLGVLGLVIACAIVPALAFVLAAGAVAILAIVALMLLDL